MQRVLLVMARLGATLTEAMHARVDPGYASNVEVLVLTSLDVLGPQRPVDIIELTGMTSGGVTKVLDRLETQGLIERQHGRVEGDRRAKRLVLTDSGRHVAGELAAALTSQIDLVRVALAELAAAVED